MSEAQAAVTLVSEDGIKFSVSLSVVRCMGLFKNLLELHGAINTQIPPLSVPNVTSLILTKIIEYLKSYIEANEAVNMYRKANQPSAKPPKSQQRPNSADDDDDDVNYEQPLSEESRPRSGNDDDLEVELLSDDEFVAVNGETAGYFDFSTFDERSLRLFTPYEQQFFASMDIPTLIEVTKAANYMNIPHLLDSCCKAIAGHMKGLSVEELRAKFNIKNDFTPEEEEAVRRETAWIGE